MWPTCRWEGARPRCVSRRHPKPARERSISAGKISRGSVPEKARAWTYGSRSEISQTVCTVRTAIQMGDGRSNFALKELECAERPIPQCHPGSPAKPIYSTMSIDMASIAWEKGCGCPPGDEERVFKWTGLDLM